MSRIVLALFALTALAPAANAKCFAFRGEDIKVCIDGDDSSTRRQAEDVCEGVVGHDCSISGYSGECRTTSSLKCYDGNGEEQRYITADFAAMGPRPTL